MLSEFQTLKLRHYFNVLDFDSNGLLEEDDFIGVGENLAILLGYDYDAAEFVEVQEVFKKHWHDIHSSMGMGSRQVTLEQWLAFADEMLVNRTEASFVKQWIFDMISLFDTDKDELISMMEYVDFFVAYRIEVRYSAKSFRRLDLNNDGFISKEELVSAINQFFTSDHPDDAGNWLFGFWSASFDH